MLFPFVACIVVLSESVAAERLHEKIYSSIEGGAACFRRLNGTHQAGCSSADNGAVGPVHMIYNIQDAEWMALNSTAGPYMAVVSTSVFPAVIELLMEHSNTVAGVLLFANITSSAQSFSEESRCPNEYSSGPGSQCHSSAAGGSVWNTPGNGLLRRDVPFPIFFLPESRFEEVDKIEKCYQRYNLDKDNQKGNPLCSVQLHSFMFAAVSTEVCLRRSATTTFLTPTKVCDPLADNNVYNPLFPLEKSTDKKFTLVTARIDSASLFDGIAPGAASSVVGFVTLLTAAALLAKMLPPAEAARHKHNIMWTLLNGEAFDYIGSQRLAYEVARGAWPAEAPLAPAALGLHVDVGQLGGALLPHRDDDSWPLYAHAPYTSDVPPELTEFLAEMSGQLDAYNWTLTPRLSPDLPPSAIHSFRRELRNATTGGAPPAVLLADYGAAFTNLLYHSALDGPANVAYTYHNISVDAAGTFIDTATLLARGTMRASEPQVKAARLATALARALYQRVAGAPYAGDLAASSHLTDELLYCFLSNASCRALLAADYAPAPAPAAPAAPAPLYVSVAAWRGPALFAAHLLALLAGAPVPGGKADCDAMQDEFLSYFYLQGWNNSGVCMETTMKLSQAISPAFTIDGYDFASGVYSSWSESVWQSMWARVFVAAGGGGARAAAAAGAASSVLGAALAYWLRRHARVVFDSPGAPGGDAASG